MSESMITRCPKCSTTFRVTQEVLNMAKGKVRCGQCFHIFTAKPAGTSPETKPTTQDTARQTVQPTPSSQHQAPETAAAELKPKQSSTSAAQSAQSSPQQQTTETIQEDGTVNPDWLDTLFNEEDLEPYTPPKDSNARFIGSPIDDELFDDLDKTVKPPSQTINHPLPSSTKKPTPHHPQDDPSAQKTASKERSNKPIDRHDSSSEDLAPWEVELAELEAQFSEQSPASEPLFSEALTPKAPSHSYAEKSPSKAKLPTDSSSSREMDEPDYMQALHSLAQDVSKQDSFSDSEYSSQESMKQLAAEYSLATLTGSTTLQAQGKKKSKHTWLWTLGCMIALLALVTQVATSYFDQGSRSPELRTFYKTACSYLGCTLPAFEDISAIEIEHIRIQSHPTLANSLQVNAIMTNQSRFAQPMPKLALEFDDLNGRPVAARLFAPQDYLHKDFLDITFMPPNTPIHIVIPIQDPGARAVTHQIKVFANDTQSY